MSDSQFQAASLHDPKKNRTMVKIGEKKPVLDVEFNEIQQIQNHLRAELTRAMVHSGVLDYNGIVSNFYSPHPNGEIETPGSGWFSSASNIVGITSMNVLINGYKLLISGGAGQSPFDSPSTGVGKITLPDPPTYGSRDDLVFLEAWFEDIDTIKDPSIIDSRIGTETARRVQLNWRIRSVAGVDFSKLPVDGFVTSAGGTYSYGSTTPFYAIAPQGGNISPMALDSSSSTMRLVTGFRSAAYVNGSVSFLNSNDIGLYVAGDGSQTSKDNLKTVDGYVYAIPLFRVKRRNSGGYRNDNLNGARDYFSVPVTASNNTASSINSSGTATITGTASDLAKIKIGDKIYQTNGTNFVGTITSITGNDGVSTSVTIGVTTGSSYGMQNISYNIVSSSDRPDGLYSNIIDANDIIDLRHQVSLTGFNYQQLLEANFDKLLRGELQTKDKPKMMKERFGLSPAPLGLQSQLMPVTVKGNDGVSRDLTNILGSKMSGLQINTASTSFAKLEALTASYPYGVESRYSSGYSDVGLAFDMNNYLGKNVVVIGYVKNINTNGILFLADTINRRNIENGAVSVKTVSNTNYEVVTFKTNVSALTRYLRLSTGIGDITKYVGFADFRIYEIDQATYDKIDVDPEFTGDKLAGKFPYVNSYPNVVENMFPPLNTANWNKGSTTTFLDDKTVTASPTAANQNSSMLFNIPCNGSEKWTLFVKGNSPSFYPHIRQFAADGTTIIANTAVSSGNKFVLTTEPTAKFITMLLVTNNTSGTYTLSDIMLVKGEGLDTVQFVPYGRWLLPYDYANGDVPNRFDSYFGGGRTILSDAQTSETITDVVESLRTPQRHIKVTQATEGKWAVGDTVQITSVDGVISGVIDADTALAKVVTTASGLVSPATITVDDISKFSVNDTFLSFTSDFSAGGGTVYTVQSIDATNKTLTITWTGGGTYSPQQGYNLIETTTSSSSPVTTATGLVGTWSGLGTKTATFTITTKPTTDTDPIKLQYSVNYPAGKGIQQVPQQVLEGKVNGERLVVASDNIVRVKANFDGKISGTTDLNPHISKHNYASALIAPSGSWGGEETTTYYSNFYSLNGVVQNPSNTTNGNMAQQIFSFDVIRAITDKLGEGVFADCLTLADKVAKAKTILTSMVLRWYGYGSSPTGNKATITMWDGTSAWITQGNHTSASVSLLTWSWGQGTGIQRIDANGFLHFIAYADPSDGVTGSTINTDYVELELQLNVAETGYDVLVPDNQFPALVNNLLPRNIAYPVDTTGFSNSVGTTSLSVQNIGELTVNAINVTNNYSGFTIPNTEFPSTVGNMSVYVKFKGKAGKAYRMFFYDGTTIDYIIPSFNATGDWQVLTGQTKRSNAAQYIRVDGYTSITGDDLSFSIKELTLNPLVLSKPNFIGGRKKKTVLNFLGKVVGSTFENPHRALTDFNSSFDTPSNIVGRNYELTQTDYTNINKLDGVLRSGVGSVTGGYSQVLFQFDLSHLGMSLSELKSALRKFVVNWTGYGSGDNAGVKTYGSTIKVWNTFTGAWYAYSNWNGTASTPETRTLSLSEVFYGGANASNYLKGNITNDQKVYVLVHSTYPASATNQSEIYTDYINLSVELADYVDYIPATPVKVRKETKEAKLVYPMKSNRFGANGDMELTYRYIPFQGIDTTLGSLYLLPQMVFATSEGTGKPLVTSRLEIGNPVSQLPLPTDLLQSDLNRDPLSFGSQYGNPSAFYAYAPSGAFDISSVYNPYGKYSKVVNAPNSFPTVLPKLYAGGKNPSCLLVVVPFLFVLATGELVLRVVTNKASNQSYFDSGILPSGGTVAYKDYSLLGKPLIKGGY